MYLLHKTELHRSNGYSGETLSQYMYITTLNNY